MYVMYVLFNVLIYSYNLAFSSSRILISSDLFYPDGSVPLEPDGSTGSNELLWSVDPFII